MRSSGVRVLLQWPHRSPPTSTPRTAGTDAVRSIPGCLCWAGPSCACRGEHEQSGVRRTRHRRGGPRDSRFSGFCVGAAQVYYNKLARRGAVLGGVYNLVRHPQYTCLAASGLGMLLLWPRYIVLVTFVAMLFAYSFLAAPRTRVPCPLRRALPAVPAAHARLRPVPTPRWPRTRQRSSARGGWRRSGNNRPARPRGGARRQCGAGRQRGRAAQPQRPYTDNAVLLSVTRMSADRLGRITALADADPSTRRGRRRRPVPARASSVTSCRSTGTSRRHSCVPARGSG